MWGGQRWEQGEEPGRRHGWVNGGCPEDKQNKFWEEERMACALQGEEEVEKFHLTIPQSQIPQEDLLFSHSKNLSFFIYLPLRTLTHL